MIHNLEFGLVDKIHLIYEQEWWPEDIEGFEFLHPTSCENFDYSNDKEAERDWTRWILGLYRVMHKPGVLGAWVTAAGARQMEKESDE